MAGPPPGTSQRLPGQLPEFIEMDLENLETGSSIHLADVKLPLVSNSLP